MPLEKSVYRSFSPKPTNTYQCMDWFVKLNSTENIEEPLFTMANQLFHQVI